MDREIKMIRIRPHITVIQAALRMSALFGFLCVGGLTQCTKDTSQTPRETEAVLTIISGDNQTGTGGDTLAAPVVIRITDASGTALQDELVFFIHNWALTSHNYFCRISPILH